MIQFRGKTCKCGALLVAPHSYCPTAERTHLTRSLCQSSRSIGFDLQTGKLSVSAQFLSFGPLRAQLFWPL